MSLADLDFAAWIWRADFGCMTWAMVGNGRRGREEGKEGLRFATMRVAVGTLDWDEPARGEETRGRVIVIVMVE